MEKLEQQSLRAHALCFHVRQEEDDDASCRPQQRPHKAQIQVLKYNFQPGTSAPSCCLRLATTTSDQWRNIQPTTSKRPPSQGRGRAGNRAQSLRKIDNRVNQCCENDVKKAKETRRRKKVVAGIRPSVLPVPDIRTEQYTTRRNEAHEQRNHGTALATPNTHQLPHYSRDDGKRQRA